MRSCSLLMYFSEARTLLQIKINAASYKCLDSQPTEGKRWSKVYKRHGKRAAASVSGLAPAPSGKARPLARPLLSYNLTSALMLPPIRRRYFSVMAVFIGPRLVWRKGCGYGRLYERLNRNAAISSEGPRIWKLRAYLQLMTARIAFSKSWESYILRGYAKAPMKLSGGELIG